MIRVMVAIIGEIESVHKTDYIAHYALSQSIVMIEQLSNHVSRLTRHVRAP